MMQAINHEAMQAKQQNIGQANPYLLSGSLGGRNANMPSTREREIHDELGGVDRELEALRALMTDFIQRLNPVLRPEEVNASKEPPYPVVATPVGRRIQTQKMALADVNSALRTALDRLEI